ncbi:MAG TPA: hypothetical protein VMW35_02930 [Myxococcota bacterium]|jgi:hypothetical protein|nr:hypothetical protein [Myxococcota bacterium]
MAKIKGTSLSQTVAALRALPDGAARLDPRLRRYLDGGELVSVADWYPEEDQVGLLRPVVQHLGGGTDAWKQMGRAAATFDLRGVYKHFLRPGDPTATIRKMAVLWSSYHDTGRLAVILTAPCEVRFELVAYAAPSLEMCAINAGYFRGMLELAGAREIEIVHEDCTHSGHPSCTWRGKWVDPE